MESGRVQCDPGLIDQYFKKLSQVLGTGVIRSDFVVNVDEVGFDGSELDPDTKCVVPMSHVGDDIPISNEFLAKRAPMIVGIAMGGQALKPMMIIKRQSLDAELRMLGYTHDKIHFSRSPTGYINKKLFHDWVSEIFLPYVRERRLATGYDGPALLLLDGCSCHDEHDVKHMTKDENVLVIYL